MLGLMRLDFLSVSKAGLGAACYPTMRPIQLPQWLHMATEKSLWSYQENVDFHTDVEVGSPFYVPLEDQRGEYSRRPILNAFGLDPQGVWLPGVARRSRTFVLFGGHLGCGKSTELRQIGALMEKSYTVCLVELSKILDINNLRFSDLLIALAHEVVVTCNSQNLVVNDAFLSPVLNWFETRIIKEEYFKDLAAEVKTEAAGKLGIPYLVSLLALMTAKVRTGASYRKELRREVNNGFTQLVSHFNALIAHVNELLLARNLGPMLFVIDGSDKLKREDSVDFFQADVNQLLQIETQLIICAPIAILLEEAGTAQRFTLRARLPMVKTQERDGSAIPAAIDVLVKLIEKRMPISYFDDPETVRYLACMCGGHPRDLLRLVRACFALTEASPITRATAQKAVKNVASEYQRPVQQPDWAELVAIDASNGDDTSRTEARMRMLYDLVLLEYNSYWWRSHPLVRTLSGYIKAQEKAAQPPTVTR